MALREAKVLAELRLREARRRLHVQATIARTRTNTTGACTFAHAYKHTRPGK